MLEMLTAYTRKMSSAMTRYCGRRSLLFVLLLALASGSAAVAQPVAAASGAEARMSMYSTSLYHSVIPDLQQPVTLRLRRVPVLQAVERIADQAGLGIGYSPALLASSHRVTASLDEVPVSEALDIVTRDSGLETYMGIDEQTHLNKYMAVRGSRQSAGLFVAGDETADTCIVVEGEFDAMLLHQETGCTVITRGSAGAHHRLADERGDAVGVHTELARMSSQPPHRRPRVLYGFDRRHVRVRIAAVASPREPVLERHRHDALARIAFADGMKLRRFAEHPAAAVKVHEHRQRLIRLARHVAAVGDGARRARQRAVGHLGQHGRVSAHDARLPFQLRAGTTRRALLRWLPDDLHDVQQGRTPRSDRRGGPAILLNKGGGSDSVRDSRRPAVRSRRSANAVMTRPLRGRGGGACRTRGRRP